jgi:hypothetical protein
MIGQTTYAGGIDGRTSGHIPVFNDKKAAESTSFKEMAEAADSAAPAEKGGFFSVLLGILDVINPLQHIPVVSTIYRHLTGDEIGPMARIAGDTLYGGPLGGAMGVADVVAEKVTGRDIGGNALAFLTKPGRQEAPVQLAQAPAENIIWDTPDTIQTASLETEPRLHRTFAPTKHDAAPAGKESVQHTTPQLPVPAVKGDPEALAGLTPAAGPDTGGESSGLTQADRVPLPLSSAGEGRLGDPQPVPHNLVAARMMEALDKYQAMQRLSAPSAALAPAAF